MATHSSVLTWRIPWTEEPGRLQSMESQSQTQLSTHTAGKENIRRHPREREGWAWDRVIQGSDNPRICLVWAEQGIDCETVLLGHPDAMDMLSRK